jgi:hypothetical protein
MDDPRLTFDNWQAWLTTVAASPDEAAPFRGRVPDEWLLAVGDRAAGVARLWDPAHGALPTWRRYLATSLEQVAIGDGKLGPVLIYFLRDWNRTVEDTGEPGAMVAGLPAAAEALGELEREHGALPASLRAFWSRHHFTRLKNDQLLASPTPPVGLTERPRVFASPAHEYLAIANPSREPATCLVRARGERAWRDELVQLYPSDLTAQPALSDTFDRVLVNWDTAVWPR